AAAQVEKPVEQPTEIPELRNTGKPMIVDYHCGEEDIRTAGLICTMEDPCPVYLELASVEAVGNRIFVAGNIHSPTTTLYSVLLASDDAGKTWREPQERIRLAGLDRIQFVDFENGWVSGEVQHPLPRDPFLLATTDGGKTWQAHSIFADPQFGSAVDFRFSSRTNGNLVIYRGRTGESGRFELYETPNAGETWILRQTSDRLIELMRQDPADADWRLRADAASKSYRVERHAGGGWRGIAAFSVTIGVCKPPEIPVPAPPADGAPIAPQRSR
ncbi:MAG TPA: hypothetical protein VN924_26445, partial [Bryobacteraceae bacterium]|nr:hypothetical protein [Bryobacteraceae bacterium]